MITINYSGYPPLTSDDKSIFVFIMEYGDNNYYKFATKSITLSGSLYDGELLSEFSLPLTISQGSDTVFTGGILSRSNLELQLVPQPTSSLYSDYINSFYPSSGKDHLSGRPIFVGVVWDGATNESDITWLSSYTIDSYTFSDGLNIIAIDTSDLKNNKFPFYTVQNSDSSDPVGYFPNASDTILGSVIPVVYGDFSLDDLKFTASSHDYIIPYKKDLITAPSLFVDDTNNTLIVASHPIKEFSVEPTIWADVPTGTYTENTSNTTPFVYVFNENLDSFNSAYLLDLPAYTLKHSIYNKLNNAYITLGKVTTQDYILYASKLYFKSISETGYDVNAISNVDTLSYITLTAGSTITPLLDFVNKDKVDDMGFFSDETRIFFYVLYKNVSGSTITCEQQIQDRNNPALYKIHSVSIPSGSTILTLLEGTNEYTTWQRFLGGYYSITNKDSSASIRILSAWVEVIGVTAEGFKSKMNRYYEPVTRLTGGDTYGVYYREYR